MNAIALEPIRARRVVVELSKTLTIDGYEMPDSEQRVGMVGASLVLGYAKNYLSQVSEKAPKRLEALQSKGFTGYLKEATVTREEKSGASKVKTLSKADFKIWIEFEAARGNKHALALVSASIDEMLDDRFAAAFDQMPATREEKLEQFDVSYQSYLDREELYQELREELAELELPGDRLYYLFSE